MLITAGPTHEPIDAVRFIGNRSSGRLGIALADESATRGWTTTLLLGPTALVPADSRVRLIRFRTTADLQNLLGEHFPASDVLIMAAAVADFRPRPVTHGPALGAGKVKRTETGLTLDLESTPDLLAACGASKRTDQILVGFALEPEDRLLGSAAEKLVRKRVDMIVANPLETMESPEIRATLLRHDGSSVTTPPSMTKQRFASWLLDEIERVSDTGVR